MSEDEFEKEKRVIATCAGYCRLLQVQTLRTKNREEMFKIQKEHAENCPQCKGNLYVFGDGTGGK